MENSNDERPRRSPSRSPPQQQASQQQQEQKQPPPPQRPRTSSRSGPPPPTGGVDASPDDGNRQSCKENEMSLKEPTEEEWESINDDVYNIFFLSSIGGQSFWYSIYVFILKLTLYTFLIMDASGVPQPKDVSEKIYITQFFMLPVAVAMQEDLIATYFLVANLKYSVLIKVKNPHASKLKFHVANICRGIDGMYSLLVNFVILMKATEVLSLFLNFAALQFLQTLDNIALRLCKDGYLSQKLQEAAKRVITTTLPNKHSKFFRSMDSVLFLSTYLGLVIAWAVIHFV